LFLLSFNIPFLVDIRNKLQKNHHIDLIKERYLIKYKFRNIEEYYVINKKIKNHTDSEDFLFIDCVGQEGQLARRNITNYKAISKNATQLLNDVLKDTSWSVGSIEGSYLTSYRSLEFSGSVYDAVIEVAKTF